MARFNVPLFSTKRRPPSSLLLKPIKLVNIFGVLALGPLIAFSHKSEPLLPLYNIKPPKAAPALIQAAEQADDRQR